jgi:hypothetical protein
MPSSENGVEITEAQKIDQKPISGLLGVVNSLGYKVSEIEKHIHNSEQWYGKNSIDGFLDRDSITSWQIVANAVAGTYGAEVQISDGTEVEGGSSVKKLDLHRLFIETTNVNDQTYKIQFWYGTGLFGAATLLTEFPFRAAAASERSSPIDIISNRIACNNKIWARCMCSSGGKTINFIVGVHTYDA